MDRGQRDKDYLRRLIIAVGLLGAVAAFWWLRLVVLLFFAAIIFSIVLASLAQLVQRYSRLSHKVALGLAIIGISAIAILLFAFLGWRIAGQFSQLLDLLPKAIENLLAWIGRQPLGAPVVKSIRQSGASSAIPAIMHLPSYALALLGGIADIVLIAVGGIYLALQPGLYKEGFVGLVPSTHKKRVRAVLDEAAETLRKWLLAQLAAMVMVGSLVAIGTWALGVPAAGALGVFAGVVEFIPIAGPVASAVPALLLAMLVGFDTAGWTLLLYVVIQQIEGNLIIPLIQQRAIDIPPVVTLFALIAFGILFGPLGIILATPLAIVGLIALKHCGPNEARGSSD